MDDFLLAHEAGCAPLRPCKSCLAAIDLRAKMSEAAYEDFVALVERLGGHFIEPKKIPRETPIGVLNDYVHRITIQNLEMYEGMKTIGEVVDWLETDTKITDIGPRRRQWLIEGLAKYRKDHP